MGTKEERWTQWAPKKNGGPSGLHRGKEDDPVGYKEEKRRTKCALKRKKGDPVGTKEEIRTTQWVPKRK